MRAQRAIIASAALAAAAWVGVESRLNAQETLLPIPKAGVKPAYDDGNVETLQVRDNIHLVAGSGANITVLVDPDGLLVVDASVPEMADKILAAMKTISPQPIRFVINTSADEHHTKGNEAISKAGRNIYAAVGGGVGREPERPQGAPIYSHELAMHRMAGILPGERARTDTMWPQNTFFGELKSLRWGGDLVDIMHKPNAHTDGDVIVWFRKADVIATGDILTTVTYPVIDRQRGGSIQGYLNALNDILDIMVPELNNQGGTLAIPGHGRICNEGDVAEIRDTMTIIRDRIADMVQKGMTLAQVKAARPTLDYDGVYGDPNAFIDAVFADLSASRPQSR
jgi:glyoxylase-like metal-dependent hydrolase (beta-lactamase superfamily II)